MDPPKPLAKTVSIQHKLGLGVEYALSLVNSPRVHWLLQLMSYDQEV